MNQPEASNLTSSKRPLLDVDDESNKSENENDRLSKHARKDEPENAAQNLNESDRADYELNLTILFNEIQNSLQLLDRMIDVNPGDSMILKNNVQKLYNMNMQVKERLTEMENKKLNSVLECVKSEHQVQINPVESSALKVASEVVKKEESLEIKENQTASDRDLQLKSLYNELSKSIKRVNWTKLPISMFLEKLKGLASFDAVYIENNFEKLQEFNLTLKKISENEKPFPIENLPHSVIIKILHKLCYRDLCRVEQVSTKWNKLAKDTWASKTRIGFNDAHVIGSYYLRRRPNEGCYAIMKPILTSKINPVNLHTIHFSKYPSAISPAQLEYILSFVFLKCTSLVSLHMFKIDESDDYRQSITTTVINSARKWGSRLAKRLVRLELRGDISDELVAYVLNNCRQLTSLTVKDSQRINGSCFGKCSLRMKSLTINTCTNVYNSQLLLLVQRCRQLTDLNITINQMSMHSAFITLIVANIPGLEALGIWLEKDPTGKSEKTPYTLLDVELVSSLPKLKRLSLSPCCLTNAKIAKILNECVSLTHIILRGKQKGLTSVAFTSLPIRAQLRTIEIKTEPCFFNKYALTSIKQQCSSTLSRLLLADNTNILSEDVIDLMTCCPRICHLDLKGTSCDGTVLEKALTMLYRDLYVDCRGSKVSLAEFLPGKVDYLNRCLFKSRKLSTFEFRMRNLKFCFNISDDDIYIAASFVTP